MADELSQSAEDFGSDNAVPRPALRILCLHGERSNAFLLKKALDVLGQRLYKKHGQIDLVYVNSPLVVLDGAPVNDESPSLRVWWEENTNTVDLEEDIPSYRGLDASLMLIQQVWASAPFWGILGVGQGAAVAAMMTLLPDLKHPPSFSIFVSGKSLFPENELLIDSVPCLHMMDNHIDQGETIESQKRLHAQFGGVIHERKVKRTAFTIDDLNAIGRFVIAQRNRLRNDVAQKQIVSLQTAIHFVEQQAALHIAEEIVRDPPAALMAVIRPQAVAGWNGNKSRQPGEQGGGAPCPPEFLLKREKRTANSSGHSREYPSRGADDDSRI